jgi:hypothetical protein
MSMHVITLHRLVGVVQSIKRICMTSIQYLTSAEIVFFTTKSRLVLEPTHPCRQQMAATSLNALRLLDHETDHPLLAADELNTA